MSRLGKMPVSVPNGVTATIQGQTVKAKGAKGELLFEVPANVDVRQEGATLVVAPREESKLARINWGLSRAMLNNIMVGVSEGFTRKLEINGVGYRAAVTGKTLTLALGYSHDVVFPIPDGVKVETPRPTEIIISGIDKQRVGQVAAEIREFRSPEPYKGKGVKYAEEKIFRKEGKKK
jgi:large subunit ribosomal protein L6